MEQEVVSYIYIYMHIYIYIYIYTHILFVFFSIMVYHRILNIVLCAVQWDLLVYPFYIYKNLHLLTPTSYPIPSSSLLLETVCSLCP